MDLIDDVDGDICSSYDRRLCIRGDDGRDRVDAVKFDGDGYSSDETRFCTIGEVGTAGSGRLYSV